MGLKEARFALSELVGEALPGVTVSRTVPERLTPPLAVVRPADDYVTQGDTFELGEAPERFVELEVVLVAKSGRNNQASDDLDDMIDAVLDALAGSPFDVPESVPAPFVARVGESNFLACALPTACAYTTN